MGINWQEVGKNALIGLAAVGTAALVGAGVHAEMENAKRRAELWRELRRKASGKDAEHVLLAQEYADLAAETDAVEHPELRAKFIAKAVNHLQLVDGRRVRKDADELWRLLR